MDGVALKIHKQYSWEPRKIPPVFAKVWMQNGEGESNAAFVMVVCCNIIRSDSFFFIFDICIIFGPLDLEGLADGQKWT